MALAEMGNQSQDERLRMIEFMVDHTAEGIFMVSLKGKILYANEAATKAFGLSREEVLKLTARDIDPNFKEARMQALWNQYPEKKTITFESKQKKKDGSCFPVELTLSILPYGDEPVFIVFAKDITTKKEEESLKQLSYTIFHATTSAKNLEELVVLIWKELGPLINTSHLEFLIYNTRKKPPTVFRDQEGKLIHEETDPKDTLLGWLMEKIEPSLLYRKDIQKLIKEGSIASMEKIPAVWLGVPVFSGDKIFGVFSLSHPSDKERYGSRQLTILEFIASQVSLSIQRRVNEEALRLSEKNLRESNHSKDRFFSIIAHDLRGPFNAIIGFSDILHNDFESLEKDEVQSLIKNIHEASVSTFKLLENLLEWSRIQTGRSKPNPENIDLSTIALNSISFLKHQAEKKSIKLFSGIQFGTIALCDENMITTVIRNLMSNAIKFTPAGGEVRIWATTKTEAIEIVVADTGVGIEEKHISKLFKLDESYKTRGTSGEQGTGLGLILCHEFIVLNKGKIWAESKPGEGSRFKFTLPKFQF